MKNNQATARALEWNRNRQKEIDGKLMNSQPSLQERNEFKIEKEQLRRNAEMLMMPIEDR